MVRHRREFLSAQEPRLLGPRRRPRWGSKLGTVQSFAVDHTAMSTQDKIVSRVVALADIRTHTYITTRHKLAKRWGRVQVVRDRLFGAVLSVWGRIPSEP